MAHGMNDDEQDTTSGEIILREMKQRLAFLDEKIKLLKPMEEESDKLRAAIRAYEAQKVTFRDGEGRRGLNG